jgi:glycosyltransferase involved in cell wall biosynthesis
MFVFNDCRTDARVLREAASLIEAGHAVTIMARPADSAARVGDRESRDGIEIVRVPIPHAWRRWWIWTRYPWRARSWVLFRVRNMFRHPPAGLLNAALAIGLAIVALPWVVIRGAWYVLWNRGRTPPPGGSLSDWLVRWRFAILGWAEAAAAEAPLAEVYHGHDLTGLPAALRAAARNGGRVVYDSHEIFLESGANATRPRWIRARFARMERRWVARCDALVTVNDSLAEELGRRYAPRRTVVVHNASARWEPPARRPDLIRAATGIPAGDAIALYHGGFSAHRGLEELAEAILAPGMERVHAVYLGYGTMRSWLDERSAEPRYGGRLHVLAAVPPEELGPWVASADVGVMPIQASTLNHKLSTPNKLFECLAAGVPVVASDFPEMRRIVVGDPDGPLGELCDPSSAADVARAIAALLALPPDEMSDLRARCLRAAHERWNWETESARLVELYADLTR